MQIKILEIRDRATFFAVLCIEMNHPANDEQLWYLRRYGYPLNGSPHVAMTHLDIGDHMIANNPYVWNSRTYTTAHKFIEKNWHELKDGDVVDVEYILHEKPEKKRSERYEGGGL